MEDILNSIHEGIQSFNNVVRNSSTIGKLEGRMIGTSNDSMDLLTRVVSREIGKSLLARITYTTDLNCIRNPYSRRYENPDNTGVGNFNFGLPDSPKIGQLYDVYWHEDDRIEFLDRTVGGDLMGYTHSQEAAEDRNENPFLDKLFAVSTYNNFVEPEFYINDVPFWRNLNIGPKRYTPKDSYIVEPLRTFPVSISKNGQVRVYNNLFEIYSTEDGPILSAPQLDLNGYTGNTRYDNGQLSSWETFYQENGPSKKGDLVDFKTGEDIGFNTVVSTIDVSGDNIKNITGLLNKTNKLFNDGKINSLINRFKTDTQNGENISGLLNSSYDNIHGLSRGRNLKKTEMTNHNGYDNPYCRVWTSHHRYSKYSDLIRPFATSLKEDTDKANGLQGDVEISPQYYTQGAGFRPFDGNSRLGTMSVLDYTEKGMPRPRIAPSYRLDSEGNKTSNKDDIKKCMFSIENLAWKDINFNAHVLGYSGKATTYGRTLREEQIGPNGGRVMWFPPYNLKFSEQISAQWNDNNFIGRGEAIKSYVNTTRRGQISFTLLVDHPSIIDLYSMNKKNDEKNFYEQDQEILRYFAGCGDLDIEVEKPKEVITTTGEKKETTYSKETKDVPVVTDLNNGEQNLPAEPEPDEEILAPDITFQVPFFFPNNYSGKDYDSSQSLDEMFEKGKRVDGITGYEIKKSTSTGLTFDEGGLNGVVYTSRGGQWNGNHPYYFGKNRYNVTQSWYYQINEEKAQESLPDRSRHDEKSYGLNNEAFGTDFRSKILDKEVLLGTKDKPVDLANSSDEGLKGIYAILGQHFKKDSFILPAYFVYEGGIKDIIKFLEDNISPKPTYKVKVDSIGYASVDGYNGLNQTLSEERANTVANWFRDKSGLEVELGEINGNGQLTKGESESSIEGKVSRCAILTIYLVRDKSKDSDKPSKEGEEESIVHDVNANKPTETEASYYKTRTTYEERSITDNVDITTYDEEYKYFKQLNENGDEYIIKKRISEKVKYFDPAFHSISPEGFNARLTFLQQCTRQGPTIAASDEERQTHSMGAGNLSFGRPPFCILRVGDFFFTKIAIDNINIQYENGDGVQWDINPEGIGVQPMFANVDISFTFLGGSDISGPIDRLQNAVSHNYYANTSVYERKADYRDGFRTKEDDSAYMWEANMNGGDDPTQNLSKHVKYSPTKEIAADDRNRIDLRVGKFVNQEREQITEEEYSPMVRMDNISKEKPDVLNKTQ